LLLHFRLNLITELLVIFGDVINLTQWPLGEELTLNAGTDDFRCELVRTLDDGDDLERLIDVDIKHASPSGIPPGASMLHTMLHEGNHCRH